MRGFSFCSQGQGLKIRMALFEKGKSGNPAGCPKGAHHIGRPAGKTKELARSRAYKIVKRFADIADGLKLEQFVTDTGQPIKIPAAVREQIKAGEVVLKVGDVIGPDVELNMGDLTLNLIEAVREARKSRGL